MDKASRYRLHATPEEYLEDLKRMLKMQNEFRDLLLKYMIDYGLTEHVVLKRCLAEIRVLEKKAEREFNLLDQNELNFEQSEPLRNIQDIVIQYIEILDNVIKEIRPSVFLSILKKFLKN
jgi:hypothetical protein